MAAAVIARLLSFEVEAEEAFQPDQVPQTGIGEWSSEREVVGQRLVPEQR